MLLQTLGTWKFLLLFSLLIKAADAKLVTADKAVFRVDEKIYFVSDLRTVASRVRSYHCLNRSSLLLKMLKLKDKGKADVPSFKKNSIDLTGKHLQIAKLLKLLQLNVYVENQRVVVLDSVQKAYQAANIQNNCSVSNKVFNGALFQSILQSEIFLRGRFRKENFWVSGEEVLTMKAKNPRLSKPVIEKRLREKKMQLAQIEFLDGLNKKVSFEHY